MSSHRHNDRDRDHSRRHDPYRRPARSPRHESGGRDSRHHRSEDRKKSSRYMTEEEQSRQFIAGEDKFVLTQAKKKADIRVRENRANPIDFITFNIRYIDDDHDLMDDQENDDLIVVPSSEKVILGLDLGQVKDLLKEVDSYHVLESNKKNRQYWDSVRILAKDVESRLDPRKYGHRMTANVEEDIDRLLKPKSFEQLEELEKVVKNKLDTDESIDFDYWTDLLKRLRVWKAKGVLARVQAAADKLHKEKQASSSSSSAAVAVSKPVVAAATASARSTTTSGNEDASQTTKALYDREAARGVAENEEVFAAEEEVPSGPKPEWSGQYQARKPRYFNRVQMGFDWNKYNQTHYDQDNPPPKVVQGYKFNIFYPDLVDVTKAPTFKIIREHGRRRGESLAAAGEDDTCLIRFIAGPPYEDVAFRIVDREWDYSAKRDRGFKSSFDKVCPLSMFVLLLCPLCIFL